MTYVIMNVETESLHRVRYAAKHYPTKRGAKIACAKLNKSFGPGQLVVMLSADFELQHNPIVTVFSLMSGKPVQIRKEDVGSCVDPSTERYWAM